MNEAIAAQTKATELMAKYKIEVSESEYSAEDLAVEGCYMEEYTFSRRRDWWMVKIINTITKHYGCQWLICRHERHYYPQFVARKCDIGTVKAVFVNVTQTIHNEIHEMKLKGDDAYSYGLGFASGLEEAYRKQDEAHPEYALVMCVPQEVKDKTNEWCTGRANLAQSAYHNVTDTYTAGYNSGKNSLNGKLKNGNMIE